VQKELKNNLPNLSVLVSEGEKGEFTVNEVYDGASSRTVFDKSTTERFPNPGEVTQILRETSTL
tara:strand:- start:2384 stop:2575 length:192 start_codon:yes stop_codon:yes gene_type:complete